MQRGVLRLQVPLRRHHAEADADVGEERRQPVDCGSDRLLGGQAVHRRREDADEQLEPRAALVPLGHVLEVALCVAGVAVGVAHDDLVVADPDDRAVAGDQPVVGDRRRVAALVAPGDVEEHALPVVVVQAAHEQIGIGEPFLGRVAEQSLDQRADVAGGAAFVELVDVDHQRQLLDDRPELHVLHRGFIGR